MDLSVQVLVDLDARLESQRGQLRQQKISNHRIQTCPKQARASFVVPLFDVLFLTAVFRVQALARLHIMVAHRHAIAEAARRLRALEATPVLPVGDRGDDPLHVPGDWRAVGRDWLHTLPN